MLLLFHGNANPLEEGEKEEEKIMIQDVKQECSKRWLIRNRKIFNHRNDINVLKNNILNH